MSHSRTTLFTAHILSGLVSNHSYICDQQRVAANGDVTVPIADWIAATNALIAADALALAQVADAALTTAGVLT